MLSLSVSCRYFLYRPSTDMRKGFDGLSGLIRNGLGQDPLSGDVFIFFNRRHNHVKLLLWEGDGFSLYYKRLERGTYELPMMNDLTQGVSIRHDELMLILQGISLKSVRKRKRYEHKEKTY
jgi:transposase